MKKEYIICSAVLYNDGITYAHQPKGVTTGFVTCGRRHRDCNLLFRRILGIFDFDTPIPDNHLGVFDGAKYGFITNTNRFVDRQDAYSIAYNADQIIGPNKGYATNEIGLTSEDLY